MECFVIFVKAWCWFNATESKPRQVVRHFMKTLEDKILSFDNWTQPWTFHEFVSSDKTLTEPELSLFNEIWTKAGDFELWYYSDLILGCKASQRFISENYNLKDTTIANIVRALSYQWK